MNLNLQSNSVLWKRMIWHQYIILTYKAVLSLEILVASDFDNIAGTAIYYPQYYHILIFKNYWESSRRVTWQ